MDRNSIKPLHVAIILLLFWAVWLYSEILEYHISVEKWRKIESFMQVGDRFTILDGYALEKRITALEIEIDELTGD